jgi:mannosylglucosylglycerate synthase
MDHHAGLMAGDGHQVQIIAGRGRQVDSRIPFVSIPWIDSRHADILSMKEELDRGRVPGSFGSAVGRIEVLSLSEHLQDTDVLIAHNVCSLNKNLALTAALFNISRRNKDLRLILWHHDLAWTTPRYLPELHEGYPWDLLKTAWEGVTQVTISDMRQDELAGLMKLKKSDITVVPNGVDVNGFSNSKRKHKRTLKKRDCWMQIRFCCCRCGSRRARTSNWR